MGYNLNVKSQPKSQPEQLPSSIRHDEEIKEAVKMIAQVTGLPKTEIIRIALKAGLFAIRDNGWRIEFPLSLKVTPPERSDTAALALNERPRGK